MSQKVEGETSESVIASAAAGGRAQILAWVADGTLIEGAAFATMRGVARQRLEIAIHRNSLFAFKVNSCLYYPAVLAGMTASDSNAVCKALGAMSPGKKMLFMSRKHGALGGQPVAEAIATRRERVLALARAWADEDRADF